jgi:hypothetical protein
MGGYGYGDHEPTEACPYCSTICRADFVDVGVGMQQCGPFHCDACGASEIGPYDESRELSAAEVQTGWYGPSSEPGSSANVINGKVVGYVQMRDTYRREFVGNPLYDEPGAVENWFKQIRGSRRAEGPAS